MSEDTKKLWPMPILVIKTGTMKQSEVSRAQRLGLVCIIQCDDPASVRFLDQPIVGNRSEHAEAALELVRVCMSSESTNFSRDGLAKWYVQKLIGCGKQAATKVAK